MLTKENFLIPWASNFQEFFEKEQFLQNSLSSSNFSKKSNFSSQNEIHLLQKAELILYSVHYWVGQFLDFIRLAKHRDFGQPIISVPILIMSTSVNEILCRRKPYINQNHFTFPGITCKRSAKLWQTLKIIDRYFA